MIALEREKGLALSAVAPFLQHPPQLKRLPGLLSRRQGSLAMDVRIPSAKT